MTTHSQEPSSHSDKHELFMSQFLRVQPLLLSYLRSVVPIASDRDDIQQEVSVALWRQFDDYDSTRPFFPWVMGITHNHVARWRRQRAIAHRRFSPETESLLAEAFAENEDKLLGHRRVLQSCIERLSESGKKLITQRYQQGLSLDVMAEQNHSTLNAVNKALGKIRRLLSLCTERSLSDVS